MVVALSLRASRVVISVFALAWFCVAALPSLARGQQHTAPLPRDMSFGSGGFVTIPSVDMNAPSAMPLGFVRLPVSAGYLVFSVQKVGAAFRVVGNRFSENGVLDTSWGTGGASTYGLPIPMGWDGALGDAQVRVAANVEDSAEVVYLALLRKEAMGATHLTVARLGADGALLSFGDSALPNFSDVPGAITAIAPAKAGQLASGNPGVLLAIQGGTDKDKAALVQVSTPPSGVAITISSCETRDSCITRPGLRINQLGAARGDGLFDLVGSERGKAMRMTYDAKVGGLGVVFEHYFDLGCDRGVSSTSSTADGLLRDTSLGDDELLIVGRAVCANDGNWHSVLSAPYGNRAVSTGDSAPECGDLLASCPWSFGVALSGRAYVVTPESRLVRVDTSIEYVRVLGRDALSSQELGLSILPSARFGTSHDSPAYLTGISMFFTPRGFEYGLGRIALDRLFADGTEP